MLLKPGMKLICYNAPSHYHVLGRKVEIGDTITVHRILYRDSTIIRYNTKEFPSTQLHTRIDEPVGSYFKLLPPTRLLDKLKA